MNLPEEYEALLESQAMAAAQAISATSDSAGHNAREGLESGRTQDTSTDHREDTYTGDKSEFEKSEKGLRSFKYVFFNKYALYFGSQ